MNIKKNPLLCGLVAGGAVLFLNIMLTIIASIFFHGESGMILMPLFAIINFPVIGYGHYGEIFFFFRSPIFLLFVSCIFYFSCAYFIVLVLNYDRKNHQVNCKLLLFSVAIAFILLGSIYGKKFIMTYAVKQIAVSGKYSDPVLKYSSKEKIPYLVKILKKMPENNFDAIHAKNKVIQTLQNHRSKEAIPILLELIKTSHKMVAEKAIEAVGVIGGPDEAVPIIVRYIKNNDYLFDSVPAGWTFSNYKASPELTQALIKVCDNIKDNDFARGEILEALSFVADYETLVKIQEQYSNELNKFENHHTREEIKRQLQKKKH